MSSAPADKVVPSPEAQQALRVISELSARERLWVFEQIESRQSVDAEELSPQWRAEIAGRVQSLQDGTAELHDLDDVEKEALHLLEE